MGAVVLAILTAAAVAAWGGSGAHGYGAVAYVLIAIVAVTRPAAIAAQVIAGQALAVSLVWGPGGVEPLLLLPVVVCVVLTAELSALSARLERPFARSSRVGLREVGIATMIAGAVFVSVDLLSGLPGPRGPLAIALASGACVLLAVVLVNSRGWS